MLSLNMIFNFPNVVSFQFAESGTEGAKLYISVASGNDSWSCNKLNSCQTIGRAITLASHGDEIYLEGTGTDKHPYTCEPVTSEYPGIYINKSLSLIGYGSPMPQIRCSEGNGLMFNGSDSADQMNVTLAGLLVNGSVMTFQDTSAEIKGCKFQENKQGLKFVISSEIVSRIKITNSTFSKNRQCISVVVNGTNTISSDNQVLFTLIKTSFIDNVLSDNESCISFTKWPCTAELPIFNVTFDNVTFSRNKFGASGVIFFKMGGIGTHNINLQEVKFIGNSPSSGGDVASDDGHSECIIQDNTVNLFLNACRFTGQNSRSLDVIASNISLDIYNSNFSGHNVKGPGGVISLWGNDHCRLTVHGSSFVNTTAYQGGAMNIKCTKFHGVSFQDSFFVGNTATIGRGGAVYIYSLDCNSAKYSATDKDELEESMNQYPDIGRRTFLGIRRALEVPQYSNTESTVLQGSRNAHPAITISRCDFRNVFSFLEGSAVAICALQASVQLHHSVFTNCTATAGEAYTIRIAGASIFVRTGLRLVLIVENCQFIRCSSLVAFCNNEGNVTVHNSLFKSNYGGALFIEVDSIDPAVNWTSQVTIENSLFLNNSGNSVYGTAYIVVENVLVILKNVTMESNRHQGYGGVVVIGWDSALKIHHSRFVQNTGGAIHVEGLKFIQVQDSILTGNSGFEDGGAFSIFGKSSNITIFNTTFSNCSSARSGGAISVMLHPDTQTDPGCCEEDLFNHNHICIAARLPLWDYQSHINFQLTTFERNVAHSGGAVHLTYGRAVFKNCSFTDTFATTQGGHIYTGPGSASLIIQGSSFNQTVHSIYLNALEDSFIHAESSGAFKVYNTTFDARPYRISSILMQVRNGRLIDLGNLTAFSCPIGSQMAILNLTDQVQQNTTCKIELFTLQFSCSACPVNSYSLQRGQARGSQLASGFQCLSCPFGANCSRNVVSKSNFWGFKEQNNPQALKFTMCPLGYCRPPYRTTDFPEYNGCQGNRNGEMCGQCNGAYTETLYSTHCRPLHECGDYWFWPLALVYVSLMAYLFTFKPPIVSWIRRQIVWFGHHEQANHIFDKGYLKIVFYFYQASNLLLISSSAQHVIGTKFIDPLIGLFNFQQKLSSSGLLCPFPGLTVVTKQLFSSSQVFGTLLIIGMFYIFHWGVLRIRGQRAPCVGPYVGGILQTMLLGYTTLASASFHLLRCVPIGSEKRLFFNGTIVCFQWWQYVLIVFILIFFVPFVLILLWGSLKLYNRILSLGEFLLACCFPLPFLLYWAYTSLFREARNAVLEDSPCNHLSRNAVERVLYDSFKRPENGGRLSLCWESVMIGRRLILIVLQAFVSDPMFRLLIMNLFCVLFLLHHAFAQPFRDGTANTVETISLMSVVVLAAINVFFASFVSLAVPLNDHFTYWWNACQVVETIILCTVPALFSVLVVAAVLSQVCRFIVVICRSLYHIHVVCFSRCCRREGDEMRPLLT